MRVHDIFVSIGRGQWGKSLVYGIFLTVIFSAINASQSAVYAQTRIPSAGSDGDFGDMQVDGDRVKILSTTSGGKSGKIQIRLDADSDWWRMLRVIDNRGNRIDVEQENGGFKHRREVIEVDTRHLGSQFRLEFWKAKFLGSHWHVMTEIYRKEDFVGRVVTFIWREGLEDKDSDTSKELTAPIDETMTVNGKKLSIKSADNGEPGFATIKFQTGFDWWTAVKLFDRSGEALSIEKINGRYTPATKTLRIPISSLKSELQLEFWTAKLLGAHTHMGSKKLLRERFDGRVVTITWGNAVAPIVYDVTADGSKATIRSTNTGTPGYATIVFRTNKAWWTALQFRKRGGLMVSMAKVNGQYNQSTFRVPISELPSHVKLELWTAKAFGVHTFMKSLSIANDRFDGRVVTVTWNR